MALAARVATAAVIIGAFVHSAASAQVMVVGNDHKIIWDENGKAVQREPGHDTLSIIDISKPEVPRVAATISLANSIVGPPTNLAIHPSGGIVLVAGWRSLRGG
jgi:hypothetical protein